MSEQRANHRGGALVTGASAGIGRAFASALAARGHDLTLVARDGARLSALADTLQREHHVTAEPLVGDLCTPDGVAAIEARLSDASRPIDLLVNNAGLGTYGTFADQDLAGEVREIELNVVAVVRLTHAALGAMRARGAGAIVNVSSLAGYQPSPNSATYGATKAFLNSFTHAVHEESRGSGVHVMVVCPGFTHTEFHERAGLGPTSVPEFAWQSPEQVVTAALRDLDHRRAVSIPGALNRMAALGARVAPTAVTRRVAGVVTKRV